MSGMNNSMLVAGLFPSTLPSLAGASGRFTPSPKTSPPVNGIVSVHAPDAAVRARIPWQYGNTGGSLGVTDKFGNITIQPGLTGQALRETVRHEGVHRFFSPGTGPLLELRADVGMWGYQRSHLLRYTEKVLAEAIGT